MARHRALRMLRSMLRAGLPVGLRRRLGGLYRRFRRPGNPACDGFLAALHSDLQPDLVLYESFYGRSMNCSPRAIFDALLTDPARAGLRHVWVLNDPEQAPAALRNHPRLRFVAPKSPEYGALLATAGVIVINSTLPTWYVRREGQTLANTWHGVPLKRMFKYESADHPVVHRNSQRNFLQASHLLIPNAFTAEALLEAADVEEAVEGRVFLTGAPRVDETLNSDRMALRAELGVDPDQKLIFIAPTWRGNLGGVDNELPMLEALTRQLSALDPARHVVFGQLHNFMGREMAGIRALPAGLSTNRFLAAVDVLISDYSSIMFDFLATGRQTILYVYDRAEYEAERGFNFALEEIPAQICATPEAVMEALKAAVPARDLPQYAAAQARFFPHEDGQATGRAIAALFAPVAPRAHRRPRLLLFAGGLKNNGITSSALNLLTVLTAYDLDVYVVTEGVALEKKPELLGNLRRMPQGIKLLHRAGGLALSKAENAALQRYYRQNSFDDPPHEAQVTALFQREARRIMGDLAFDAAIDFSGYSRYWSLFFAQVVADHKVIYQHNDLYSEATNPQKGHRHLLGLFRIYPWFDRIVSVSEETRQVNLSNLAPFYRSPEAAVTVRNVIVPAQIRARATEAPPEGVELPKVRPLFVMAGRLSPEKAQGRAIRALGLLRRQGREAGLILMGDGPLEEELRAEALRAGVEDLVVFAGHVSNPFPIVAQGDCFVLSSDYEGQPMVLLEALTLGKPVIATDIPGSRSVLGGKDGADLGCLVPATDEGVALGMARFLDGEVTAAGFAAEAYRDAALQDFFNQILGQTPARR